MHPSRGYMVAPSTHTVSHIAHFSGYYIALQKAWRLESYVLGGCVPLPGLNVPPFS